MIRSVAVALSLLAATQPAIAQRSDARSSSPTPVLLRIQGARPQARQARQQTLHPMYLSTTDSVPWSVLASMFATTSQPPTPFILSPAAPILEGRAALTIAGAETVDSRDGGHAFIGTHGDVLVSVTAQAGKTYLLEYVARHSCTFVDEPCPANPTVTLHVSVSGQATQTVVVPESYPVGVVSFHADAAGVYYVNFTNDERYYFRKVRVRELQ